MRCIYLARLPPWYVRMRTYVRTYYSIAVLQKFNNCARHARSLTTDCSLCCIIRFCLTFITSPIRPSMPTLRPRLQCACTALHTVPPHLSFDVAHALQTPASFAHALHLQPAPSFRLRSDLAWSRPPVGLHHDQQAPASSPAFIPYIVLTLLHTTITTSQPLQIHVM